MAQDEDKNDDKDEALVDDLDEEAGDDDEFGPDEDESEDDKSDDKGDDKGKDDKESDTVDGLKKKLSSALAQKGKWRDKYNAIIDKSKDGDKPKDDRQKDAKASLKGLLKEVLAEEAQEEETKVAAFDEELEDVMETSSFTEKEIVDVCEEFGVTPKAAAKILQRGAPSEKPKPKTPKPKRGGSDSGKDSDDKKVPKSFAEARARAIKRINITKGI